MFNISEMLRLVRKHFMKIVALSLLAGIIGGGVASLLQKYTCTLGFKYNHEGALEGLAPDGVSKLDPYEIQNPVVVHGALAKMGLADDDLFSVDGIRQNISISKVISNLDKDVSESAALLGNKYEAVSTEYEMTFTYSASLGDEFGPKMFSNLITEYDKYLLDKYYNLKTIVDFVQIVKDSDADYIVVADNMNNRLEGIMSTLKDLAANYPDYRSVRTGYTFAELETMYQNLSDIEYAKYYGNIRAGNLAKDREMVIKNYQAKVKDLTETMSVSGAIAENYKSEIATFYDSYKAAGLYRQAERVQENTEASNNRDNEILYHYDVQNNANTYDNIILSFTDRSGEASDASRTVDYYNEIIRSYETDTVPQTQKDILIAKNEKIFEDLAVLSAKYSKIANETIGELYNSKVNSDLQYLIIPEVSANTPVKLIAVFLMILTFGIAIIAIFVSINIKRVLKAIGSDEPEETGDEKKKIDTSDMDELHKLLYEQYLHDFDEMYLVYQSMNATNPDDIPHKEVFLRWNSPTLGMVSPGKTIDALADFGIFKEFNAWVIRSVCEDLSAMHEKKLTMSIVHINCPYSQINDFALNDIILEQLRTNKLAAKYLCFELSGNDIADSLEDITLLADMGVNICIDQFEDSDEGQKILRVIKPGYIKLSLNSLNPDIYETSEDSMLETMLETESHFAKVIKMCHENKIKVCICGIENSIQDKMATYAGFDYKQGYFYDKPEKLEI